MSVQCNTYVMIGATFPYELFRDDDVYKKLEPFQDNAFKSIHHHEGLCVLIDGMNGDYVAVGVVLAKSADHEGLVAPLVIRTTAEETAGVATAITNSIGKIVNLPEFKVTPIVLSHYR